MFVVVLLVYAIYWVLSDINKQKANDRKDAKILETFEEYDIRKQILQQLDKFSLDSITKTKIFDSLSNKVDTYKNLSPGELKEMIETGIKELEKRYESSKKPKKVIDTEDYEDDEEQAKLDAISKSFKITKESFAKDDIVDEPAPVKRQEKTYDADIANILDNTSAGLETVQRNLTKLKHILTAEDKDKREKPPAQKKSATIEGFENRASNSYAYY